MYEFLVIVAIFAIVTTVLLTVAHWKEIGVLKKVGKIMNVLVTSIAFINIFANDLFL
eukprot:CAMPEP_0170545358 /NCGR_PEP_ID=MMETSP0211-20121228/3777_1 /TAXON_ID=311385 /ORGANISM="Pseudokeronopsis sp., Strain OXSARD2" /LENGTH=56 /DNA_ID=CAMNT_0010849237 /DNA_START=238 /DNA_END=408 /DNA_ORIENTATION=-